MKLKSFMVIFIFVVFITLFYILFGVMFWPTVLQKLSGRNVLGKETYSLVTQKNTIVFPVNNLAIGMYVLRVFYIPHDSDIAFQTQQQINFEINVQMRQGKKVIEKSFQKIFENEREQSHFTLFWVPFGFLWSKNANLEIIITDIKFDDEFKQYFKEIYFQVWYYNLLSQ